MRRVFADTSWFIALISSDDALHERASVLADEPLQLVTTAWVMVELAAYLSSPPNRQLFTSVLSAVRNDKSIEFVVADDRLFEEGAALYDRRLDKEWSLVDCISFVVMRERRLSAALTGDHHFEQAGYSPLLIS